MSITSTREALSSLLNGMRIVKYGLSTLVLIGATSAFIAVALAPAGWFFATWLAATVALVGVFVGIAVTLRVLRARRFGDAAPGEPVTAMDVILNVGGVLAGVGGLILAVPALLKGDDVRTWSIAVALCLGALVVVVRDAVRYVTVR